MGLFESKEELEEKERLERESLKRQQRERERLERERLERQQQERESRRERQERERLERQERERERQERERERHESLKMMINLLNDGTWARKTHCLFCHKQFQPDLLESHLLDCHKVEKYKMHRAFGEFRCSSKCKNRWNSAWVWCVRLTNEEEVGHHGLQHLFQQVYAQECKRCENPTFARTIDELTCSKCGAKVSKCRCERKARNTVLDMTKPHETELCHRCQRLGRPCTG